MLQSNQPIVDSKFHALVKSISIFILSIVIWHLYRFVATYSSYESFFAWGTLPGYLFYLGIYILLFVILLIFIRHIDHSSPKAIGLRKVAGWRSFVLIGISFAFFARFFQLGLDTLSGGVLVLVPYPQLGVIAFFAVDTLFVAMAEEGIFRGYIQGKLMGAFGFPSALLLTVVLFHVYHEDFFVISMGDLLLTAISVLPSFGMFAGYLYHKSRGNLLGPISLHMFYDLFGTIVPLGVVTTGANSAFVSYSNVLIWFTLIVVLKLLSDRMKAFRT